MNRRNLFYAQSGGVTAVINATACAVIETARAHRDRVGEIYAGRMGILGALREDLIDTGMEPAASIAALRHTPGGAFGSVRYKLGDVEKKAAEYQRLIEVFRAHDIGYFVYNGGGDSMDTANKVAQVAKAMDYDIACVGVPKTIDNDLPVTDNCPGFGSVAKYVAISTLEAGIDVVSMPDTKVFILEVMGRHAGWIAAASALAGQVRSEPPHVILFPEIAFDEEGFVEKVRESVERYDNCVVVASEGIRRADGSFVAESGSTDAFGHAQLGGVAPYLAALVRGRLGYKFHFGVADYLQRSARHVASAVDVEQAYAMGRAAVEMVLAGVNGKLPVIVRTSHDPYRWEVGQADLSAVANVEKKLPREFIADDGFHVTDACRRYLEPLIQGEDYPPYRNGLPVYVRLNNQLAEKKLPPWDG